MEESRQDLVKKEELKKEESKKEESKKEKKVHRLSTKLVLAILILGVFMVAAVDVVVSIVSTTVLTVVVPWQMQHAMDYALQGIEVEEIEKYITTLEKDAYYDELCQYLSNIRGTFELDDLYIMVPVEDGTIYIADGLTEEDDDHCDLGDMDPYVDNGEEVLRALQENNELPISFTNTEYGSLASTAINIYNSEGVSIAVFCADMAIEEWLRIVIVAVVISNFILIFLVILLLTIYYNLVKRIVVVPVQKLVDSSQKFMRGKLENGKFEVTPIKHKSNDEMGVLIDSFVELENDVVEYTEDLKTMTAKKEKYRLELNTATSIQAGILPKVAPGFTNFEEFELAASMNPAKEVGGDLYDFFMVDKNHLAMVIGDVSGKGVPAALFMMVSKTLLKSAVMGGLQPGEALASVNDQLCESNDDSMFVTVWIGIMDIHSGHVVAANGGHEYPLIKQANGQFELFKDKHGMPLGGIDRIKYTQYEFDMEEDGAIFVYTDGVPEATNADEELFGNDRMIEAVNTDPEAAPEQILANVRAGVNAFVKDADQFDDLTMLCVKRKIVEHKAIPTEPKHYEISLPATIENIEVVIDYMESEMEELTDVNDHDKMCISVAIDEICCNIVKHGYEDGTVEGNFMVCLEFYDDPKRFELSFIDSAWPYNPLTQAEQPDVNADLMDRKIGGLGIYMVRKTMDDSSYEFIDGKNILKFTKMLE